MAKVRASIVHDETGRIVSIARPSKDAKAITLSGNGHSVFETELEEDKIPEMVAGSHRVDLAKKTVVSC
jgi:hypothetical protein